MSLLYPFDQPVPTWRPVPAQCAECGAKTTGYLDLRKFSNVLCMDCALAVCDIYRLSRLTGA